MTGYKNLEAWKKAMILVKISYELSVTLPKDEIYGLNSQIKRAAVSIPANIAEGCGRQYKRDTRQFLYIARGSLYELETLFDIALLTGAITKEKVLAVYPMINEELKILNGLIAHYENEQLK